MAAPAHRPLRLVLDTNVVVAGLLWNGPPRRLIELAIEGDAVELFSRAVLLDELAHTLGYSKFSARIATFGTSIAALVAQYMALVSLVAPVSVPHVVVNDADDDHVIAAALEPGSGLASCQPPPSKSPPRPAPCASNSPTRAKGQVLPVAPNSLPTAISLPAQTVVWPDSWPAANPAAFANGSGAWLASHSFNAAFTRVCQPTPPALKAPSTSASRRMATCSFGGFLPGPRARRMAAIVAATPPPGVTMARDQLTLSWPVDCAGAAAWAAAICAALKVSKVVVGFLAIGIAAGD